MGTIFDFIQGGGGRGGGSTSSSAPAVDYTGAYIAIIAFSVLVLIGVAVLIYILNKRKKK